MMSEITPRFGTIGEAYPTKVELTIHGNGCPCGVCGAVTTLAELVPTTCTGPGREFFTWFDRYDVYTDQSPARATAPVVVACSTCIRKPQNFIDGR